MIRGDILQPEQFMTWQGAFDTELVRDELEQPITVWFCCYMPEPGTQDYPGCPATADLLVVNEMNEDITGQLEDEELIELEREAFEWAAD